MREHALDDQKRSLSLCLALCLAIAPRHAAQLEVLAEGVGALLFELPLFLKALKLDRIDFDFPHPIRGRGRRRAQLIEEEGDTYE